MVKTNTSVQTLRENPPPSPPFPTLLNPNSHHVHMCSQSSWMLSRMGAYFSEYYKTVPHAAGRPPIVNTIATITGISKSTVDRHAFREVSVENMPNSCPKIHKQVKRRDLWIKTAEKYEPFIQA